MQQATYTARTRRPDGTFNLFHLPVEVVGETVRSYRVRLLRAFGRHPFGAVITVRRHNVRLARDPQPRADCSGQWWHD